MSTVTAWTKITHNGRHTGWQRQRGAVTESYWEPSASPPDEISSPHSSSGGAITRILVTAAGWGWIRDVLGRWDDGHECGGPLYGYRAGDTIVVTAAGEPGIGDYRAPQAMQIPLERAREVEWDDEHRWVGSWHTHPQIGRELAMRGASEADKDVFCNAIPRATGAHAGVIVHVTGDEQYRRYSAEAWVGQRNARGITAATPVRLDWE